MSQKKAVSGRRKQVKAVKKNLRGEKETRRIAKPKHNKNQEKRADMQIISAASQGDIYTWAVSMVIMASILVIFIMLASIVSGNY